MKHAMTWAIVTMAVASILAQDQKSFFEVIVSSDTILMGSTFEVRFTAKNAEGQFEPPVFADFDVLAGPNHRSQINIVNGQTDKSQSYSYILQPKNPGVAIIEPAFLVNNEGSGFETSALEIICLPNPDGKVQNSRMEESESLNNFGFGSFPFMHKNTKPKKKKLKVTKI